MMSKLHVPEAVRAAAAATTTTATGKGSGSGSGGSGGGGGADPASSPAAAGVMLELLEGTLWQRQLGSLSEEMVAALVCQVRIWRGQMGGGCRGERVLPWPCAHHMC